MINMNTMDSKIGDLIYIFRNLMDALNERSDSFEKDDELLDLIDEAQKALDVLDYDEEID